MNFGIPSRRRTKTTSSKFVPKGARPTKEEADVAVVVVAAVVDAVEAVVVEETVTSVESNQTVATNTNKVMKGTPHKVLAVACVVDSLSNGCNPYILVYCHLSRL